MPTIAYLVHGMGAGTSSGDPRAEGEEWYRTPLKAVEWVASTFSLSEPQLVLPGTTTAPPGATEPDAIWVVPISYHEAFDEFRRGAQDRASAVQGIGSITDFHATKLASQEFLWVNCLDVLLWWADRAQAQKIATARVLEGITEIDELARSAAPGAVTRRILITHSLGNAAATYALSHLVGDPAWVNRGAFSHWFALANVAPFLLPLDQVYRQSFIPGKRGSLITAGLLHAEHELDPFPHLLPPRRFRPGSIAMNEAAWNGAASRHFYRFLDTRGIVAPPEKRPSPLDVHGFANYLLSEPVARGLAEVLRGGALSDEELDECGWPACREDLPALRCAGDADFVRVREAVRDYRDSDLDGGPATRVWLERLMTAAELLMAAEERC